MVAAVVVVTKGAASKPASPNYLQHVLFVNAISSALLLFASILYLQKCVAHCYFLLLLLLLLVERSSRTTRGLEDKGDQKNFQKNEKNSPATSP